MFTTSCWIRHAFSPMREMHRVPFIRVVALPVKGQAMTDRVENCVSLGAWVRRRRKALDLTQAALAHCVSCAEVTIRKIETDAMRPSRRMAERLARCLDLSSDVQAVFLQVACGERGIEHLPAPLSRGDLTPPARTSEQLQPALLPLDNLPAPAPLPPGSRMPLRRNPLFVGRDWDLCRVAQALTERGTGAIGHQAIAAVTGLGGIGKTQLVCEFVHHYGQFFAGGVFWLSFADPMAIPAEVAACGGSDGMQLSPVFGSLPLDEQVQRVRTAWTSPLPRLLVFDNCEEESLLEQWRPTHGGCRILVTSRHHYWDLGLGVQPIPLDVLRRDDSLALLRSFRPDLPAAHVDLAAIAAMLGDLPLALHLAGSFLAKYRHALTPAQYRERLGVPTLLDDRSLQAAGVSPTQHVQHVARTFEQSFARLDPAEPTDALARTLLAHAACCAPGESLPRWLLLQTLALPAEDVERTLGAEDALTRLIDLGLLETDATGSLRLHRLVVAFVHAVLVDEAARAAVEVTMLRVADTLNEQQTPRALLALQPHLRFITEVAQPRADTRTAALYNALGYHLRQLGVYAEAQACHEQALAIRQRVLGADHLDTVRSLNNLGLTLQNQGQYAAAQVYLEQALEIRLRVLGTNHLHTAKSMTNLGSLLGSQGQYAAAQRAHEQALTVLQQTLGMDHPYTAYCLNSLGVALAGQGQYAAAQHAHEQALAMFERVLGRDHPHTALSLYHLGEVLQAQAQYTTALDAYTQALAIRQRMLGHDHPHTALSLRGLGEVLYTQGQGAQARPYLEDALAIFVQQLGPEHPDTERTRQLLTSLDTHRTV